MCLLLYIYFYVSSYINISISNVETRDINVYE